MTLYHSDDAKWQAVVERDQAARGAFLIAVKTTRIYCLPGCSARTPLRKNITFYASSDAAEQAGYRPCKRCGPK